MVSVNFAMFGVFCVTFVQYGSLQWDYVGTTHAGPTTALEGLVTDTIVMSKRESLPLRNVPISVLLCEPGKGTGHSWFDGDLTDTDSCTCT